ncbi:unnamed protein product [Chilo suppressalis]|uniref:Major facilitator superfamily (MFS) profile domain-containing protein n=1 Tax=Chilo suppressalis TaxID=168631 RepID=A0ABN8B4S6_CHISP|nr:hypothetical protein evm_003190 [Chilo suppressalis]CAH0403102.1 unnamed protein product [Chilo suppressalis]
MKAKINNEISNKNTEEQGHTRVQWIVVVIASLMMFLYGMENGWMSPMTKVLTSDQSPTGYPLSGTELSWVSSVLPLTAVCLVPLYAFITDAYGRKFGVLAVGIPQLICCTLRLFATNTTMLILSRASAGVAASGCFISMPIYVREICQDSIRGATVAFLMLMQNFGLLTMYLMGSYLSYHIILWITITITVLAIGLIIFAPESPAFLAKNEKYDEAAKTLALLRGLEVNHKIIELEINEMRNEELRYKSLPEITFINIFKNKAWRSGFLRALLVNTSQSGNGTFAIMTYGWVILSSSKISIDPDLQTLVVPILMIFGSMVSLVFVQKFGRKVIIVSMQILIAVAMTCMGVVLMLQHSGFSPPGWVLLLSVAISVWAYAAGVVSIFYVIVSEMFSFQVRSKIMGILVSYSWFVSSLQLIVFVPISEMFGMHTMFFIYAGVNVFGGVGALLLMPETKDKTVEEIERILSK